MGQTAIVGSRISEIFGRGHPGASIISSAGLAVMCFFYAFTIGTYFQVRIYPLVDRVTYYTPFNLYVVNEYADHVIIGSMLVLWLALALRPKISRIITGAFAALFAVAAAANYDAALDGIALAALPAVISLYVYDLYSPRKILARPGLAINYFAIIGIITGLASLAFAVSSATIPSGDAEAPIRNYAHEMSLLFSSFSPILLLLLITCLPVKLLIDYIARKRQLRPAGQAFDKAIPAAAKATYLSLFMLLSVAIAVIPHLPSVNTDGQQVGVDSGYYAGWVRALNDSTSPQDFLYQAFVEQRGGDRPVSLIFLYALQIVANASPLLTAEYAPVILGPALVIAVYLLTRELTSNDTASLLAAFLTAMSFQVLIGIYAGFYSNWLALIFGYLAFVFLLRFLKKGGKRNLAFYGGLFVLALFSHVYTWTILAIATGIFLAAMLRGSYRKNAIMLMAVLAATVMVDVARVGLTGSSGGIEEDLALAERLAGPEQFMLRWNNLTYATTTFVGGVFANFIILGLGLYWLYRANIRELQSIFLVAFLSVGIMPFIFGNYTIQTRSFYDIPFQIPAAIALAYIARQQPAGLLRSLPIYIWLVAMSVMAVSNFYLILPAEQ